MKKLEWYDWSEDTTIATASRNPIPIGYGVIWWYSPPNVYKIVCNGREIGRTSTVKEGKEFAQDHFDNFVNSMIKG
jgi:hypothetical protein